jgi:hypothetical protein
MSKSPRDKTDIGEGTVIYKDATNYTIALTANIFVTSTRNWFASCVYRVSIQYENLTGVVSPCLVQPASKSKPCNLECSPTHL